MIGIVATTSPPRAARASAWSWLRYNLFSSPANAAITCICAYLLFATVPAIIEYLVLSASFDGLSREDCTSGGACWVFVRVRFSQFMYGFYPVDQRWRVDLAGALLLVQISLLVLPRFRFKALVIALAALIIAPTCLVLLSGGMFGLRSVETREWGGFMVTMFMAYYGTLIAAPLSLLLALGRQSRLPVIKWVSTVMIEFWRGVPMITVIFLASNLLPLIVPAGVTVDKLTRALIAFALVAAAYMAEVLRGGLQSVPKGQYEAASALGLGYWRATSLIILPQAIRPVIPNLVNEFISLFKNTTLVLIVSLFDMLGIIQSALTDPKWVGLNLEGYLFAGAVYWAICFSLSQWSQRLERRLATKAHR